MKFISRLFGKTDVQPTAEQAVMTMKPWSMRPVEARMRASLVVKQAAKLGVELNYSAESLLAVDMLIDKDRETKVGMTKEMQWELVSIGAYVGEVMAKHLGGKWARGTTQPLQDPLVMVVGGKYAINVVSIVFRRFLAGEPASVAGMFEETKKLLENG